MKVPFLDLAASTSELRSELDDALRRVLDKGWYVLGDEVEAFEREFAAYCGARHCVSLGNGLDALLLLLRAKGIGPGDEVLVPSHTFIATWLAVTGAGATPVPVEVDPRTRNLDPALAARAVTARTRAVMPVHLYGLPAAMEPLRALCRERGLALLEDAAQAHGARYQGKRAGALGDAAGWSFYPGKNLGALGDGGAVTTDDDALAASLRMLRNYGSRVKYQHEVAGVNSRLDELQAAALRVKLRHLDAWNARRERIARRYLAGLEGVRELGLPSVPEGSEHSWHLFVIEHPERDRLQTALADAGVQTLVHYPVPVHRSGAYRSERALPVAERLAATVLSLPMGPQLADEQVDYVCDRVRRFV